MSERIYEGKRSAYRWFVLAVGLLAGIVAPYNFFKAAPLIPTLMEEFRLTEVSATLLMMLFAICITVLSLPAGIICTKAGAKKTTLLGLLCIIIGSAIGAMATSDLVLFLGRIPEGIGMGFLMTSGIALIVPWFPPEEIGTVMAVWATFMPLGNILGLNLSGLIASAYGWRWSWWSGFIFAVIMFILVFFVKEIPPEARERVESAEGPHNQHPSIRNVITNVDLWLADISLLLGAAAPMAFASLGPTYLSVTKGLDITYAASITSLLMASGIFGNILGGILSDKIRSRKIVYTVGLGLPMIIYPLLPYATGLLIPVLVIIWGFIFNLAPPAFFAVPPDILDPKSVSVGLGLLSAIMGLAIGYPPLLWGVMVGVLGSWNLSLDAFLVLSAAGTIIGLLPKKVK